MEPQPVWLMTMSRKTRPPSRWVAEVSGRACETVREVFGAYVRDPARLGTAATNRIEVEGMYRTICDYIAGMTDRYLLEEHAHLVARVPSRT